MWIGIWPGPIGPLAQHVEFGQNCSDGSIGSDVLFCIDTACREPSHFSSFSPHFTSYCGCTNQGNPIENRPTYSWNNLRFRSNTEIKIAEALDKAGVLFFPNCMARLGPIGERRNKEADFLICDDGKWGILEIDGEAYHSNAATDHERDRFFRTYGIRVIERFTASQCYNNPEAVIRRFLVLLKKNA